MRAVLFVPRSEAVADARRAGHVVRSVWLEDRISAEHDVPDSRDMPLLLKDRG